MKKSLNKIAIMWRYPSCKGFIGVIKRILYAVCMLTMFAQGVGAEERGLTLIWSDEFDYEGLPDSNKWSYEEGYVRSMQFQYYTKNRKENARVENGVLVLEARKEEFPNAKYRPNSEDWRYSRKVAQYTSASLHTRGKATFQYGRIEVRAKLPRGAGLGAAIWLKTVNTSTNLNKLNRGEIDIMEHVARRPNIVYATSHFSDGPGIGQNTVSTGRGNLRAAEPYHNDFHVYAIEWDEQKIKFFVDDRQYATLDITEADVVGEGPNNPFRRPHEFLLSFPMGGAPGNWRGDTIDDSALPQKYEIDYVRVYKMNNGQANIVLESDVGLTSGRAQQLNEAIMPRLTQAMLANTLAAVSSRIDGAFSEAAQNTSYQLDSRRLDSQALSSILQATLQKLPTYAHSLKGGTTDMGWRQMLTNSSFVLSLNDNDRSGTGNSLSLWGSSDYSRLSGAGGLDWNGAVFSVQLGVDLVHDRLLLGSLVSWSGGDVDLNFANIADEGSYQHQMVSVHPYLALASGGTQIWASLGYGQGELEIELVPDKLTTDTSLLSLAAGAKSHLSRILSLKSDLSLAQTNIDKSDHNAEQHINSQRLRLLLEINLLSNRRFTSALEVGLRYDGGGDSGFGGVLDTAVSYANPATNLTLEGRLHTLIGRDGYSEWGVSGVIRKGAGGNGQGLSFSLSPSYGAEGSSAHTIWQQNQIDSFDSRLDYHARLDARFSYGLFAFGSAILLMPYSEITYGATNSYRLGVHWPSNGRFDVKLYGEHHESDGDRAEQAIRLDGRVHF